MWFERLRIEFQEIVDIYIYICMKMIQNPTKLYYTNSKIGYTNSILYYTNRSLHLLMQRLASLFIYTVISTFSLFHIYGCLHFHIILINSTLAQQIYIYTHFFLLTISSRPICMYISRCTCGDTARNTERAPNRYEARNPRPLS